MGRYSNPKHTQQRLNEQKRSSVNLWSKADSTDQEPQHQSAFALPVLLNNSMLHVHPYLLDRFH